MTQYAVPTDRRDSFGAEHFEAFVRDVVAKEQYFGTKAAQIQRQIVQFFGQQFDVPEKKDASFWLERYSMVSGGGGAEKCYGIRIEET